MGTSDHAAPRPLILGLSPAGLLALAAVVAVLVVVSLPRLHGLARRENQGDARATAELLARALARLAPEERGLPLEEVARRTRLTRALRDAEWLEEGRVLRLHGYLFELCLAPGPEPLYDEKLALALGPEEHVRPLAVRAWPWSSTTGNVVFLATEHGPVLAHENEGGAWQGLARRPEVRTAAMGRWRALP